MTEEDAEKGRRGDAQRELPELPEVAVNFALTWDGRVTTRHRTRADFSSPRDKRRLLEIRASGDAILAGRGTVETERMRMRIPEEALRATRVGLGRTPEPYRVVVSGSGRLDPNWALFSETDGAPVLIFSTSRIPPEVSGAIGDRATLHLTDGNRVDLRGMLQTLRSRYGVRRVICEGGPVLLRELLNENLVDELNITFCPRIFGGLEAPTLTAGPGEFLPQTLHCRLESLEVVEGEAFARYRVEK